MKAESTCGEEEAVDTEQLERQKNMARQNETKHGKFRTRVLGLITGVLVACGITSLS